LSALGKVSVEEDEERLHLGFESLLIGNRASQFRSVVRSETRRAEKKGENFTFLYSGSSIFWIMAFNSLRMALAETPVAAVLKSYRKARGKANERQSTFRPVSLEREVAILDICLGI
jgi:hypothetical protein